MTKFYMCKTDYDFELDASGGRLIYNSIENLTLYRPCAEECGIVEVSVELVRIAQESSDERHTYAVTRIENNE